MRPGGMNRVPRPRSLKHRRTTRVGIVVTAGLWLVLVGLFYYQAADQPMGLVGPLGSSRTEHRSITGVASVVDGDTLEIHGRRIRLFGIDAPEADQMCTAAGQRYRCGQKAAFALADFVDTQTVSCEQRDTDQYGRAVATCSVGIQDLGAWLVAHGHALAYRRYSNQYVAAEEAAAAARQGVWAGEFQPPWEWRHR